MVQGAGCSRFIDKTLAEFVIGGYIQWQEFQRNLALQFAIFRLITTPMPPSPSFSRIL